jgi:hypothetical protein
LSATLPALSVPVLEPLSLDEESLLEELESVPPPFAFASAFALALASASTEPVAVAALEEPSELRFARLVLVDSPEPLPSALDELSPSALPAEDAPAEALALTLHPAPKKPMATQNPREERARSVVMARG